MRHGVDQLLDFASVYCLHHRLSAGEMAIQGAGAAAGAARDFFEAHIQPAFREPRLGGVDQQVSIPGTVGAGFARLGHWLSCYVNWSAPDTALAKRREPPYIKRRCPPFPIRPCLHGAAVGRADNSEDLTMA